MQTVRHILTAVLILAMLVSGLPVFTPEDANQDIRMDLKDAVLHVQDFAQTADNPAAFAVSFKNVVSTMQVLAGLKTVIACTDDAKSTAAPLSLDRPCLISLFDFSFVPAACPKIAGQSFCYQSILFSPDSPPPRHSVVC